MNEQGKSKTTWRIRKFDSSESYEKGIPDQLTEFYDNTFLREGVTEILMLATLIGGTAFGTADARLGVGTSDTAAGYDQTALQDASAEYVAMDASYPTVSEGTVTFRSTFGTGDANYAWNEFSVDNNNAINWNRKVSGQGTKTAGSTWELTLEITIT